MQSKIENRKSKIPILVLALAYLHCLSFSWLKWGDVLMDCGRELDIARQVSEGRTLYSQVACDVGPLPACLNGFLFYCFGAHVNVMLVFGLFVTAVMCLLLYFLARRFTGVWGATIIASGFLYMCAFAHLTPNGAFNFVLPYRYSATYGAVLMTASLLFLVRRVQEGKRADLFLSWLFLWLTALTKQELFLAIALTHALFIAGGLLNKPRHWRAYLLGYAAVAVAVAAVYAFFFWRAGGKSLGVDNASFIAALRQRFLLLHMGLEDVPASLLTMLYSFLAALGLATFAFVLGGGLSHSFTAEDAEGAEERQTEKSVIPSIPIPSAFLRVLCAEKSGLVLGCALSASAGALIYLLLSLELSFRLLPALGAGVLLALAWQYWRHPEKRGVLGPELLVWCCGVACLARMGLRTISYHYGFYLLPVALLAFGLLWFRQLPRWLGPYVRVQALFGWAGAGLFLGLIGAHLQISLAQYRAHTVVMDAPRGRLLVYNPPNRAPTGRYLADAIDLLSQMPPATRAIVVPQGTGLTFFSGLTNALGVFGYVETEFGGAWTDEALLEQLKAAPPDLVVWVASDTSEHGSGILGKTYAVKSWKWIVANYQPCVSIGRGFIVIRCRSDVDPSPMLNRLRGNAK